MIDQFSVKSLSKRYDVRMFKLSRCADTGNPEWVVKENEDDNLEEEIALSTYGDMLHDKERNDKYDEAIQNAVSSLKMAGQKASK